MKRLVVVEDVLIFALQGQPQRGQQRTSGNSVGCAYYFFFASERSFVTSATHWLFP